jgi:hypothetical protein
MVTDRDDCAAGASTEQIARDDDERDRPGQAKIIDPSVGVNRQPEGRRGRVELDTLHATSPLIEALEFENLRSRHGEGQGGKCEVQTFEPQRCEPIETYDSDEAGGRAFIPLQRQLGSRVSGISFLNMFCSDKVDETRKFFVERDHGPPAEGRASFHTTCWTIVLGGGAKPGVRWPVRFSSIVPQLLVSALHVRSRPRPIPV